MRAVIPSLNYSDFLSLILPYWVKFLPADTLTVVTAPADTATQAVCKEYSVSCCVTDVWTAPIVDSGRWKVDAKGRRVIPIRKLKPTQHAILNKASALNEAFGFTPGYRPAPPPGEPCLALDCDVVPFGTFPSLELAPSTLYGVPRYECLSVEALHAHSYAPQPDLPLVMTKLDNKVPRLAHPNALVDPRTYARKCLGYFQLFPYRQGLAFDPYPTAAAYDLYFVKKFKHHEALSDLYVLHLGPQDYKNWTGRTIPPLGLNSEPRPPL